MSRSVAESARVERLRASLILKAQEIADSKKATDRLMEQRRTLILAARDDGSLSYVEMAKAADLSKSQVYKIVTNGFTEPATDRPLAAAEPVPA